MDYILNLRQKLLGFEKRFWEEKRSFTSPSIFQHDYLTFYTLYQSIQNNFLKLRKKTGKKRLSIIDIGCGDKPYKSLFEPFCKKYVGVDIRKDADIIAPAEKIPVKNNSFDLALCFQVLEHCRDPQKAVSEIKRILKKGGYVLASTHGVWHYHPGPIDFYRWTDKGLVNLFKDFKDLSVEPTLKSYSTVIQLINIELFSLSCRSLILKFPLLALIVFLNIIGKALINRGLDHISINYFVYGKA